MTISAYEWLRQNQPEVYAAWAAGALTPAQVDWIAGWEACRAGEPGARPVRPLSDEQRRLNGLMLQVWACAKPQPDVTPEQLRELLGRCLPFIRAAALAAPAQQESVKAPSHAPDNLHGALVNLANVFHEGRATYAPTDAGYVESVIQAAEDAIAALAPLAQAVPLTKPLTDEARDAARYRWLRADMPILILREVFGIEAGRRPDEELDAATDAAIGIAPPVDQQEGSTQ